MKLVYNWPIVFFMWSWVPHLRLENPKLLSRLFKKKKERVPLFIHSDVFALPHVFRNTLVWKLRIQSFRFPCALLAAIPAGGRGVLIFWSRKLGHLLGYMITFKSFFPFPESSPQASSRVFPVAGSHWQSKVILPGYSGPYPIAAISKKLVLFFGTIGCSEVMMCLSLLGNVPITVLSFLYGIYF